ncbi:MAG: MCP four helix bundle domain-containing protein [Deltaproteobacteria bacterium]|nr:MAG: MCP four helix bundle domain-containing protein [Deltaproteobacteria bacterium]
MNANTNISIKQRLSLGFLFVIALFVTWGMISLKEMHTLADLSHTLYNHPLAVSNASLKAGLGITKMHRSMKDVVLLDSRSAITFAVNTVDEQEQMVLKQLDIIRDKIIGSEGQNLEKEARKLFVDWRNIRNEVIELASSSQRDEAALITMGKGAAHVAKLESRMLELTAYARSKADTFMQHSKQVHSRAVGNSYILILFGILLSAVVAFFTIKHVLAAEVANQKLVSELNTTLEEIKTLRGVIPICSHCKDIRNDEGQWDQLEEYIRDHSDAEFSHGICPDCKKKYYSDLFDDK